MIVPPVSSCLTASNVRAARDIMTVKKISALPVVEVENNQARLKGIVSFVDLAGVYDDEISVQQVMSNTVYTIGPNAHIQEAAAMMIDHKVHHLVVMEGEKIVGIVSSMDFVKLIADKRLK